MSTKDNFATWALDNAELLERNNVNLEVARMIWDASDIFTTNRYIEAVYSGELIVNPRSIL